MKTIHMHFDHFPRNLLHVCSRKDTTVRVLSTFTKTFSRRNRKLKPNRFYNSRILGFCNGIFTKIHYYNYINDSTILQWCIQFTFVPRLGKKGGLLANLLIKLCCSLKNIWTKRKWHILQYASKEKIHIHQKKLNFMLKQLVFLENHDRIVK